MDGKAAPVCGTALLRNPEFRGELKCVDGVGYILEPTGPQFAKYFGRVFTNLLKGRGGQDNAAWLRMLLETRGYIDVIP